MADLKTLGLIGTVSGTSSGTVPPGPRVGFALAEPPEESVSQTGEGEDEEITMPPSAPSAAQVAVAAAEDVPGGSPAEGVLEVDAGVKGSAVEDKEGEEEEEEDEDDK